jgi:hypothetical protein
MWNRIRLFLARLTRGKPKYKAGDVVTVRFRFGGCNPVWVKCRIHEVGDWYGANVYKVFSLEDNDYIWWGFTQLVFNESIQCPQFVA